MPEEPEGSNIEEEVVGLQDVIAGAVREHLPHVMLTGFLFVAEYMDSDGEMGWMHAVLPGQSTMHSVGLAEWSRAVVRADMTTQLYTEDDEED